MPATDKTCLPVSRKATMLQPCYSGSVLPACAALGLASLSAAFFVKPAAHSKWQCSEIRDKASHF